MIKLVLIGIICFVVPISSFAYEPTQTHAGLTEQIVEFYNLSANKKITNTEKELIIKGAVDEDAPSTRAVNHFYDPVRNIGIEGGRTAKDWATIDTVSNEYSWDDAITAYAKGDTDTAFVALGHIVHLIEDMGVPDHTRNDQHLSFLDENMGGHSPFEDWAMNNKNRLTLKSLAEEYKNEGYKPRMFPQLSGYFDFLANYSNKNFFSRDTIESSVYSEPVTSRFDNKYVYGFDKITSKEEVLLFVKKKFDGERIYSLVNDKSDTSVLSSYFDRLSRQIIPSGAGAINLFFTEGEKAKILYQEELRKKAEEESRLNAELASHLSKQGTFGLILNGFGFLISDNIINPIATNAVQPIAKTVAGTTHYIAENSVPVFNIGKFATVATTLFAGEKIDDGIELASNKLLETKTLIQQSIKRLDNSTQDSKNKVVTIIPKTEIQKDGPALHDMAIFSNTMSKTETAAVLESLTVKKESITADSRVVSAGGGGPSSVVMSDVAKETTPQIDILAIFPNSIAPISPSHATIASTTVVFSGTYTNNSTFDTIVFELKNISTSTATSSVAYTIATTTGTNLAYNKEIKFSEEGDWQYHARLEDRVNASSTPWSALTFFSLSIGTTTPATNIATSTATTTLGYTIVAEQSDHSTLDTTPSFVQGVGIQRNVILSRPVTFTGLDKGDKGRIVVWYRFGYGQDCSTIDFVGLSTGPSDFTPFSYVSAAPNWDGSCEFRLYHSESEVTFSAQQPYALLLYGSSPRLPPYAYGKSGSPNNAVYCRGNDIRANSCGDFSGSSANLSDFAYVITADAYVPPPIPEGASSIPPAMSPVVAEQSDRSTLDATEQPSGYIIQHNVALSQRITFTGANKGDKGRIVAWYSFNQGQDCATIGAVGLGTSQSNSFFFSPISQIPNTDGSCIFHLDDAERSVTLEAGTYALYLGNNYYREGSPRPFGKNGVNDNAVFCKGGDIRANSCGDFSGSSANLSDFAYVITADAYGVSTPSSAHSIVAFDFLTATSTIAGIIDENSHTVHLTVPFGADIRSLAPRIAVSPRATSSPASFVSQDFTNPVVYTIVAENGSIQKYVVTVSVALPPATATPDITYSFNGTVGDIAVDFATTTPTTVTIVLNASQKVDWKSITIEDVSNSDNYRRFLPKKTCDGNAVCAESWDGILSPVKEKRVAPDGVYRIKVRIKDMGEDKDSNKDEDEENEEKDENKNKDYFSPYFITVKNTIPMP